MIETVIFDIGNVLLKTYGYEGFYLIVAERLGLEKPSIVNLKDQIKPLRKQFTGGKISKREFYEVMMGLLKDNGADVSSITESDFYGTWNSSQFLGVNDGIAELCRELKNKEVELQILSNMSISAFDYIRNIYPTVFAMFNDMVISYAVGQLKGDGTLDIYRTAFSRNRAKKPENCVFADDKKENVKEATQYGFLGYHYDVPRLGYDSGAREFREFLRMHRVLD